MERDTKNNLKDTGSPLGIALKDSHTPIAYNKTNKLITALYMVTDIMDQEEPLRNKLRTLGASIISDMHYDPADVLPKISEIMSFLDIAGAVNLISDMNANILRKEFFELKGAIEDSIQTPKSLSSEMALSDLFRDDYTLPSAAFMQGMEAQGRGILPKGEHTRIGVQKGNTLLKALHGVQMSGRPIGMSNRKIMSDRNSNKVNVDFEALKKSRREEIIKVIRVNINGATITDIRSQATGLLANCSEKTLQRELIGMVKSGVLKKTGEKRWSRYFLV